MKLYSKPENSQTQQHGNGVTLSEGNQTTEKSRENNVKLKIKIRK